MMPPSLFIDRWLAKPRPLADDKALRGGRFGIITEAVWPLLTVANHKVDKHQGADNGDKPEQQPPSAAVGIVQATGRHRQRWQQHRQRIDGADQLIVAANQLVHHAEQQHNDDVAQHEHPVFGATGPPAEYRILLEDRDVPVHCAS
ncbi:hypothetical protein AERO8C_20409 [Aeromonas veronii]|uniref:Uncharacterized protein n=1 Tax=Aeromonas veronii TaxID=654 RepID=A0A653L2W1_AERVE|nr:hypothetical protein AERO8C_20409 [Aeromonas veronii]